MGNNPAISQLNDYALLMSYLFSDKIEESSKYLVDSQITSERVVPPITKLIKSKKFGKEYYRTESLLLVD